VGKLGTHSLRKDPSTYASRFGLLIDWISLRGRWRTSKKQVDVHIDVDVPYPDAKVASVLCGPRGPCKYATRAGVDLTDDFFCSIAPRCVEAFGREVGIILARSLLWAAYEKEVRTNNQVLSIIPSDLGARIKAACGGGDVNPIEKVGLLVSQRMDQLEIFPVSGNNDHDGGGSGGGGGGVGVGGGGGGCGGGGGGGLSTSICCERVLSKRFRFESARSRFEMQSRAFALDAIPLRERPLSIRHAVESICSRCDFNSRAMALGDNCPPARRSRCEFGSRALVLGAISRREQVLSI